MLHVLFVILKIIGIVLAALLGLLILILLLALFVPIRYKGKLRRETELEVTAKVSWLLHIISVPVIYQDGALSVKIKFLGITVKRLMEDEEELDRDAKEFFQDAEDEAVAGEVKPEEMEKQEVRGKNDIVREEAAETEEEAESDWKEEEDGFPEPEMPKEQEKSSIIKRIFAKIRAFFLKILGIWKKIKNLKYTFRRFCDKIRKGIQKYRDTKEFLTDERTKAALKQCVAQLKLLIRKLFPKKIRGNLHFGTEDPALTGEILGGISIFYPIFMDNVKVYPDFEQKILEGDLFMKGRIRLITVLLVIWRLWRDKNIRYVYHKFR